MNTAYFEGHALAEQAAVISPERAKELAAIRQVHMRMRAMHWDKVTFVNLHPWSLHASGPMQGELRINAAPVLTDLAAPHIATSDGRVLTYGTHSFLDYKIEPVPNETGGQTYAEVLPITLALDYLKQHTGQMRNRKGGVFCYAGIEPPHHYLLPEHNKNSRAWVVSEGSYLGTEDAQMTVQEAVDTAHKMQVAHYIAEMDRMDVIAANEMKGKRQLQTRSEIGTESRKIAEALKVWGIIAKYPAWFTVRNLADSAKPNKECPQCSAEAKAAAIKCTNGVCGHIFEPFQAYKDGLIDIETPGALLALRRLSKDELVELGIYPMVKPADEHRAEMMAKHLAEVVEERKEAKKRGKQKDDETE